MLSKLIRKSTITQRLFSTAAVPGYKKKHSLDVLDQRFFEKDFWSTGIEEVEFVRSPYYEMAKRMKMSEEESMGLLEEVSIKNEMVDEMSGLLHSPFPTRESVAFTRYADEATCNDDQKHIFQFPKGEPLKRSIGGALFKFQKPPHHWEEIRRSKEYIAETFFPPVSLKNGTLIEMFEKNDAWRADPQSPEFIEWREAMVELMPKLQYDALIEFSMYTAFEAKVNERSLWRAFESAVLENFHLYDLKQTCQMMWAIKQLKPRYTSDRFSNMLYKVASDNLDSGKTTCEDIHNIMQGHRFRKSRDFYWKIQKGYFVDDKARLFGQPTPGNEKEWANNLVNTLYSVASNQPRDFGRGQWMNQQDTDDMLVDYEDDLSEAASHLDGEGITRLAQAMYLMRSRDFVTIWYRIENRVHDLIEIPGALDNYNIAAILRSFARGQENQMVGSNKLFIHLEPTVMKIMDQATMKDLGHIMYAYGIRGLGNPELHKAFEKRIEALIDAGETFDFPFMSNLIYYMMFRKNVNQKIWEYIVEETLNQEDILPGNCYKPYKYSKFFLQYHFPKWDLSEFYDKFWYAERHFNQVQLDIEPMRRDKYLEFKGFLNQKCLVFPICYMTQHNLFNLHYVFWDQKIAIQYHVEEQVCTQTKQPSEKQKLTTQLLGYEDWEIMDLAEVDFKEWGQYEKIDEIKGWLKAAEQRQIEKGVCKAWAPPV